LTTASNGTLPTPAPASRTPLHGLTSYLLLGVVFGVVLTKSEVISWFRVQEMFRFQSVHMYGVMATAVFTAWLGLRIIRRFQLRTTDGSSISVPAKLLGRGTRYWAGGFLFGIGWAIAGACPGPLFAMIGNGAVVMSVSLASALFGTWVYGMLRPRLPH
jgi:uncharacterized protein